MITLVSWPFHQLYYRTVHSLEMLPLSDWSGFRAFPSTVGCSFTFKGWLSLISQDSGLVHQLWTIHSFWNVNSLWLVRFQGLSTNCGLFTHFEMLTLYDWSGSGACPPTAGQFTHVASLRTRGGEFWTITTGWGHKWRGASPANLLPGTNMFSTKGQ
jgi:hypothetical protein